MEVIAFFIFILVKVDHSPDRHICIAIFHFTGRWLSHHLIGTKIAIVKPIILITSCIYVLVIFINVIVIIVLVINDSPHWHILIAATSPMDSSPGGVHVLLLLTVWVPETRLDFRHDFMVVKMVRE